MIEQISLSLIHYILKLRLCHVCTLLHLIFQNKLLLILAIFLLILIYILSSCNLLIVLRSENSMALILKAHWTNML